jgi:hypothetical protein
LAWAGAQPCAARRAKRRARPTTARAATPTRLAGSGPRNQASVVRAHNPADSALLTAPSESRGAGVGSRLQIQSLQTKFLRYQKVLPTLQPSELVVFWLWNPEGHGQRFCVQPDDTRAR